MNYDTKLTVDKIKKIAKIKVISIGEMLSCCQLSKNALSSMQSRGSWLQANNLAKIADELDCSVDYLLGRTDNPNSHKQYIRAGVHTEDKNIHYLGKQPVGMAAYEGDIESGDNTTYTSLDLNDNQTYTSYDPEE